MGNIERYRSWKCPVCGHFTPPVNGTDFVPMRLLNQERAKNEDLRHSHRGAVDLIERAIGPITEALNNPAHSWHGTDEARKWLIDAARARGQ